MVECDTGHPWHAWLDIVEQCIYENESGSECDDDDDIPEVVDAVCGIESDDETLKMQSNPACCCMQPCMFC